MAGGGADQLPYPDGPSAVPADLTRPSAAYRRHAYLAMFGLLAFGAAYLALAGWFAWTSYRLLRSLGARGEEWFVPVLGGAGAGFLAVFMLKALIFVKRGKHDGDGELRPADHPRLFAFLHRLADEARAPRPHRVFLSPRVNAGVFYDLSIVNLILPSKKNLEIGLGLVNVLTLGELKAVLAHEFGHFAQRTMAVGRWVYIAQQIAGHIVVKRDALDRMLSWISTIDLRVAWIGWILRTIVWSIRSLVDTMFGWVMLAQRALDREMERQADLVAVSLTGSDALVHALHRLEAAEEALDRAIAFADTELAKGRAVGDLFTAQSFMLERMRVVFADPAYGRVPPLPADPSQHRLFEARLAHPPRMWSTHPPNEEREANAKRRYVPAPLDDRSPWLLFDQPDVVRTAMTARAYQGLDKAPEQVDAAVTTRELEAAFARTFLDPAYRGMYLGRSIARAADDVDALVEATPAPLSAAALTEALAALYPERLVGQLEQARELREETTMLEAVSRGVLDAPGGIVRHRGRAYRRKELPRLVAELEHEVAAAERVLTDHDRAARTLHRQAARLVEGGWEARLVGLLRLHHWADHVGADLEDARGVLQNVVAVVTADGRVSDAERERVVGAAAEVHSALRALHDGAGAVDLGGVVVERFDGKPLTEVIETYELPPPAPEHIGDWLGVIDSWIDGALGPLGAIKTASLEALLQAEELVAAAVAGGPAPSPAGAPAPPAVPTRYRTLRLGAERPRQTKLGWWDRFQIADGFVPAAARFAVAGVVVGGVILAGRATELDVEVTVYNGLGRPVLVAVGDTSVRLGPHDVRVVDVAPDDELALVARTVDGERIDVLTVDADDEGARYVYNVAGAAAMVEWTAHYSMRGDAAPDQGGGDEHQLGAPRWRQTHADIVLVEPPETSAASTQRVLSAASAQDPQVVLRTVTDPVERASMIRAHARWEPVDGRRTRRWLEEAAALGELPALLAARLERDPDDVLAARVQIDDQATRAAACAAAAARQARAPGPIGAYLSARCAEPIEASDEQVLTAAQQYPGDAWLGVASGMILARHHLWDEAGRRLREATPKLPALADLAAETLARVDRVLDRGGDDDLWRWSERVVYFSAFEDPGPRDDPRDPMARLARGELAEASTGAAGTDRAGLMAVLVAASDGAESTHLDAALVAPADSGALVPYYQLALAVRAGRDPTPHRQALTAAAGGRPGADTTLAALDAALAEVAAAEVAPGTKLTGLTRLEAMLPTLPLLEQGVLAMAVVIAGGERTPPAWRQLARALLYVGERPYLR